VVNAAALDFLKPQFAGKLVTAYPADDDATLCAFDTIVKKFDTIVKKYGWGYMKKYMAQKTNFIQGHLGELRSIADGTNAVTFDSTSSTTGALKKAGTRRTPTPLNFSSIGTWRKTSKAKSEPIRRVPTSSRPQV
jgi:ABC-type Fe3+ transport system substrate-binding protein